MKSIFEVSLSPMRKPVYQILFFVLLLSAKNLFAQPCTNLGQTPSTAFPVCGTAVFQQSNVPICSTASLFVPGCSPTSANYENKNPYFYRFTCFQSGSLAFVINPMVPSDDYDWQLYDITNKNPNDIFTDQTIVVTGNWSGTYGATGASATGVNYIQCGSDPTQNLPTFSSMPMLIQGHEYLLLVSHFTDSQSGYTLSFGGGSAVITDTTAPHMAAVEASCDGTVIKVKLNKKFKCSSLATNGSDFLIGSFPGQILRASTTTCNSGFDMSELVLTLSAPLQPGNYQVTIRNGSDANTLLDICDRPIPAGETLPLIMYDFDPTPMDSIIPPGCAPTMLELVFKKGIKCNSISTDGSEFRITGPSTVRIIGVGLTCDSGLTGTIKILLSAPIQTGGIYYLTLSPGADGNTISDECAQATPDTTISFEVKDTVNANFTYMMDLDCRVNTVRYQHPGGHGVNSWNWSFGQLSNSPVQFPVIMYTSLLPTSTQLIVSNGVCSDTVVKDIIFDNRLEAAFEAPEFICPGEQVSFTNQTIGNVSNWTWDMGNGNTYTTSTPPLQIYSVGNQNYSVVVRLIAKSIYGCQDTAYRNIQVINNCDIEVPSAFTPNGDGLNDQLFPINAYKAGNLSFDIYNRLGQRIFHTNDWTRKWDGTFKGQPADPGTYVWVLSYIRLDTNRPILKKGTTVLIR